MTIENNLKLTFKRINEKGELETVDTFTGDVIHRKEELELLDAKAKKYPYFSGIGQIIAGMIREGDTIQSLAKKPGFPPAEVMYRWKTENQDFRDMISEAIVDRGDVYHDKIVQRVDNMDGLTKDEVPTEKLVVDTLKWLAEKDNPERYGNKTKVIGEGMGATVIHLSTGINRDSDLSLDESIPAKFRTVLEKEYAEVRSEESNGEEKEV